MRERVRLHWLLEAQTPAGVAAHWLLQQGLKDHVLEAMSAFWYPFALQSQSQEERVDKAVPVLSAKAEALLSITRLERQIALLRQTFLDDDLLVSEQPDVAPSAVALAATQTVLADPTAATDADVPALSLSPHAEHSLPVIRGFESFDQSLSQAVQP